MNEKQTNSESDSNSIKFNFDDFDIDSFELKPVNRGLGFHKTEERIRPKSSPNKIDKPRANTLLNKVSTQKPVVTLNEISINSFESEKPAFFNNEVRPTSKEETHSVLMRASAFDRGVAFLVDLLIILVMMAGAGLVLVVALEYPLNLSTLQSLTLSLQFNIVCIGAFSVLYILYFGVMDMHSSLGKELMGLTVRNISQKNLAFTQTLTRALLSLFSFVALGLPLILDFHSRLTDSCVFKSEK